MKRFEILFSPRALEDIDEAVDYYNQVSWGLGNRFLTDYSQTYKSISLNPFFASVKYNDVRCAAFKRFPFSIHYLINKKAKTVTIVAVFNTWKEPFW